MVLDKQIQVFIEKDIQRSRQTGRNFWFCQCPYCNDIFSVRLEDAKSGHTKSCGCVRKAFNKYPKIQIGKQYGSLKVLEQTRKDKKSRFFYLCECQCGNICEKRGDNLVSGNTQSCGCQRYNSRGEKLIEKLLKENNFSFEKEKTFETCRFPDTNALARFDFYVNQQYIIEYDGQQHFIKGVGIYNNPEKFKRTQDHDSFKTQWCKNNNIPLIRIPYTMLDNLTINDLILK